MIQRRRWPDPFDKGRIRDDSTDKGGGPFGRSDAQRMAEMAFLTQPRGPASSAASPYSTGAASSGAHAATTSPHAATSTDG